MEGFERFCAGGLVVPNWIAYFARAFRQNITPSEYR